jgi:hypothetical protein
MHRRRSILQNIAIHFLGLALVAFQNGRSQYTRIPALPPPGFETNGVMYGGRVNADM